MAGLCQKAASLPVNHGQAKEATVPFAVESFVLCISPLASQLQISARITFLFLPSFILFKSKPFVSLFFCTFLLFPWLPLLSALYTIYLSLRFPLCLSHSVLIFLILLSSLPPFLLLYPTPSSLWLLSLFTFICLSPFSPLQACHSIMPLLGLYLWKRKEEKGGESFICCPYLSP